MLLDIKLVYCTTYSTRIFIALQKNDDIWCHIFYFYLHMPSQRYMDKIRSNDKVKYVKK